MAEQRMRELGRDGGVAWLAERLRRERLEDEVTTLAKREQAERIAVEEFWRNNRYAAWRASGWADAIQHQQVMLGEWIREADEEAERYGC